MSRKPRFRWPRLGATSRSGKQKPSPLTWLLWAGAFTGYRGDSGPAAGALGRCHQGGPHGGAGGGLYVAGAFAGDAGAFPREVGPDPNQAAALAGDVDAITCEAGPDAREVAADSGDPAAASPKTPGAHPVWWTSVATLGERQSYGRRCPVLS